MPKSLKEIKAKYGEDILDRKLTEADSEMVKDVLYDMCKRPEGEVHVGDKFIDSMIDAGLAEDMTNEWIKETINNMVK